MTDQPAFEAFDFRCLASDAELEPWLDLVVEVFGPLGIPRSYFRRHWTSDVRESARLDGILVAVERASGRMVATVLMERPDALLGGVLGRVGRPESCTSNHLMARNPVRTC